MIKGIFIALGANLPSRFGSPVDTLIAARTAIIKRNIKISKSSRIWLTTPVPFDSTQEWFHNAVIQIKTDMQAENLLETMLDIEEDFGRVRGQKNAARILDLDLIAYDNKVIKQGDTLIVPHPRMSERLFVLKPLEDIHKDWVHPESGQNISQMLQIIDEEQQAKALDKVEGWI
jgi:2-amino-4-hydroxy-6-hydroxymethyldihydropteridine diphosphokinase